MSASSGPTSWSHFTGLFPPGSSASSRFSELVGDSFPGISFERNDGTRIPSSAFAKLAGYYGNHKKIEGIFQHLKLIKQQLPSSLGSEYSNSNYNLLNSAEYVSQEATGDSSSSNSDSANSRSEELVESTVFSFFRGLVSGSQQLPDAALSLSPQAWKMILSPSFENYFSESMTRKEIGECSSSEISSEISSGTSSVLESYPKANILEKFLSSQKVKLSNFATKQANISTKALQKARKFSREAREKFKLFAKTGLHHHKPDNQDQDNESPEELSSPEENHNSSPDLLLTQPEVPGEFIKIISDSENDDYDSWSFGEHSDSTSAILTVEDITDAVYLQEPSVQSFALESQEEAFYEISNPEVQYGSVDFSSTEFTPTSFAPMNFAAVVYGEPEASNIPAARTEISFPPQPPTRAEVSRTIVQTLAGLAGSEINSSSARETWPQGSMFLTNEAATTDHAEAQQLPMSPIQSPVLKLFQKSIPPLHLERNYTLSRALPPSPEPEESDSESILQPDVPRSLPGIAGFTGEIESLIVKTRLPKRHIMIVRSKALDSTLLQEDSDNEEHNRANSKESVDCLGTDDDNDARFEENLANDMFDYLDETEDLAEECHRGLFGNKSWELTELSLRRIEEDTGFSVLASPRISRFVEEADSQKRQSKSPDTPNEGSKVELFGKVIPRLAAFDDLEKELNQVGDNSDIKIDVTQEARLLVSVVDSYRQIFTHLIRNVVLPCGDRIRKLLREILFARTLEGELLIEIPKISREISTIRNTFETSDEVYHAYLQSRITRCLSLLKVSEAKYTKIQEVMDLLESGFSLHITGLVETITKISLMRDRVLEKYDLFYMLNHNSENLGSDVHHWTRMSEYKKLTTWHYDLDISEFQTLLTENIRILRTSSDSIGAMVSSVQENMEGVGKAFELRKRIQQCNLL